MDDPTPRSKKDWETECVLGGSCSQARAPIFLCSWLSAIDQGGNKIHKKLNPRNRSYRFHAPHHWDIRLPQHVLHFRFL